MKKIIYTISILACLLLFTCCEKNKAGTFKLRMVVFEDADNGISDIHDIEFSKVYFRGKKMLELVPNKDSHYFCMIEGNEFSGFFPSIDALNFNNKIELKSKARGAISLPDPIEGYENRKNIQDTILEGANLRRFCINTENEYSVFYIGEKLDIPFSLNKKIENDYNGSIRRIDTYQREQDRFISLRLSYTDTIPEKFFNILK